MQKKKNAEWLAAMDVGERTFVRTPYLIGLSRKKLMALFKKDPSIAFSASKGTPQGDVVSFFFCITHVTVTVCPHP